jgi:hypothetical protein
VSGNWNIAFRRSFDPEELELWSQLVLVLDGVRFDEEQDKVSWSLEPSGFFSTRSMYKALSAGPQVQLAELLWTPSIPLKSKIFSWQLARGRLPSNDQLLLRRGPSNGNCALCGLPEDVDHIFFNCSLAQFMWSGLRDMFSVNWSPASRQDWLNILANFAPRAKRLLWTLFVAQSWALWITRNKFSIEGVFPKQPADVVFKLLLTLQLWRPLQKRRDLPVFVELERLVKRLFSITHVTRHPQPNAL